MRDRDRRALGRGATRVVTAGTRAELHRGGAASCSEALEQARDHASIHRTEDRVVGSSLAEGTALRNHRGALIGGLGSSGKTVRGQRLGDRRHRRVDRSWGVGRAHARGKLSTVFFAHLGGHALGLLWPKQLQRALEKCDQQVVAS